MEIEELQFLIKSGKSIENVIEEFNWKEFEDLVSNVFEENDFKVIRNFRYKTKTRYEIDILALKGNYVLCVDCKEWGKGRYKKSGIKRAARKQEERIKQLKKFLKNNPIAREQLKIENQKIFPLIVTWLEEDLVKENNTFVVPIWKLNSFLLELEKYL